MIVSRYIQRNIHLGTAGALLVLVSLSMFFMFVRELKHLGEGSYDIWQVFYFISMHLPERMVEFLPLAALLGSILSLGALAGNSEVIAMQASGVSMWRMLAAVLQAALGIALVSYVLSEWVVPDSSVRAQETKMEARQEKTALRSDAGLWVKDRSRVIHISAMLPNGFAREIEIYQLDSEGKLVSVLRAQTAVPAKHGWELLDVEQSFVAADKSSSKKFERMIYEGKLSPELLQVLVVEPALMSSRDLFAYLEFLDENGLDGSLERLLLWKKIFAPLSIVTMCLLAFPFVLGVQRQSSTGHRLMLGILLGLAFVVVDQLVTQLGGQFQINPVLTAILPSTLFLGLALYLLVGKQSHGLGSSLFFRAHKR